MKRAYLLLESGDVFTGKAFGYIGTSIGEVVFNTSMSGYQEIITDPSYKGQIVSMTYTQIGNYGINEDDSESVKPYIEGFIVKEYSEISSNFRSKQTISDYLKDNMIVGISGIDTRKLTKLIRTKGSLKGAISSEIEDMNILSKKVQDYSIVGKDMVQYVTCNKPYTFNKEIFKFDFESEENLKIVDNKTVVVIDFGVKENILRYLKSVGFNVVVVPAYSDYNFIMSQNPDALFLSNGPGDPRGVDKKWINEYKKAVKKLPTFGICFGHQIISRCFDMNVYKMKFGHHGGNHPVKDIELDRIDVTAQNHNYAVEEESLKKMGFEVTHINLNDGSVEGMKHKSLPIMSVQHHPESSPGPHDAKYLFKKFASIVKEN